MAEHTEITTTTTTETAAVHTNNEAVTSAYLAQVDASPKSVETYSRGLRNYTRWMEEHGIYFDTITRADVLAYRNDLAKNVKTATANTYLVAVRGLHAWITETTNYPDVAAGVKNLKVQKAHAKDALTPSQARDLLTVVKVDEAGLRDAAILSVMCRRGLRTVEVVRADVGDLRQVGGQSVLYVQGKGHAGKDDFVVLGNECEKAIRAYLKVRRENNGELAQDAPLFAGTGNRNHGGRMTTRTVSRIAKEAMKEQGLDSPRLTAHSLRHTAVTVALMGGATVQETQSMARHANVETTLLYAHNIAKLDGKAEAAIDAMLDGVA